MSLWLNSDGNLLVGSSGAPIVCDNCPCVVSGCASGTLASTYTMRRTDADSGNPHSIAENYHFIHSMAGCDTSDPGQDLDCPWFGGIWGFGFFEWKIFRTATGWASTRDSCGGNILSKSDGIDLPTGTYGSWPANPGALVT